MKTTLLCLAVLVTGWSTSASELSLAPDPLVLSVRSGESASAAINLTNTGTTSSQWKLELADENNRSNRLEDVLATIDASGTTLNGPLPSRFDFSEGETGTSIGTGSTGIAIFSQGNKLGTSSGGPLAYSNGVVASSSLLGTGGRYFTRKLPGLFLFAGDLNGPSWFEVGGNLTYGNSRQSGRFTITHGGKRWSAFVVKTADFWRTINQLILVDQDGLDQTVATSVNSQQQRVTGLSGKRRVYYLLFVSSVTTFQPDSVFEDLAARLLATVPVPVEAILSVVPSSGTTGANSTTPLTATANAVGIPEGVYPATVNLKTTAGALLDSVPATIQITAPRMNVPAAINQNAVPGMVPVTQEVPMSTGLPTAQPWSASIPVVTSWLSIVNASGTTPEPVKLRFNPGSLSPGIYRTNVRITSGSAAYDVPVVFTVTALSISGFFPDPERPLLYAINKNGLAAGSVLVIDPLTRRILRSIEVGKEPTGLDLTEDGSRMLVINSKDPSISVIDPADWQVVETVPLAEFTSRSRGNGEPGAHVKCGKGDIVYYVDEQWGPRLRVFNLSTRQVLQTLSSESGSSPNVSNNFGYGGIALNPARTRLFGWAQYGDGAGIANTHLVRFDITAEGTLEGYARSATYSTTNFTREPLDSPVLFSADGSRLVIKDREVNQNHLDVFPQVYVDEIYTLAPNQSIVTSSNTIHSVLTGEPVAALPATSSVQALLPDLSALVYFNTSTSAIGWLDLEATLGAATLGLTTVPPDGQAVTNPTRLEWPTVHGYTRYQVYLGTDEAAVNAATMGSPLYLGEASGSFINLPTTLPPGQRYFWRVVPIDEEGNAVGTGTVRSFIASTFLASPTEIKLRLPLTIEPTQVSITVTGADGQPAAWTMSEAIPWFVPDATSGTAGTPLTGRIVVGSTAEGIHTGSITVSSGGMSLVVPLEVKFYQPDLVALKADPSRDLIYGLHQGSATADESQLLAIRASTGAVEKALSVGGNARDFAITPTGDRIYISNNGRSRLRVVDPATFTLLSPLTVSTDVNGVAADGKGRVFLNRTSGVEMLDGATGASLWTGSSAYNFQWGVVNAAGTRYYTTSLGTNWSLVGYDVSANPPVLLRNVNLFLSNTERPVLSADGTRVFNWSRAFDPELNLAGSSGEPVKCTVSNGLLAVGATKVWWAKSGVQAAVLPVSASLSAVSRNDRFLLLYNASTRRITSVALDSLVPFPGLSPVPGESLAADQPLNLAWPVSDGATSYRVFLGTSETEVQAAAAGSPLELGTTATTSWSQPTPLPNGFRYFWRVDRIMGNGVVVKGAVWWFEVPMPELAPMLQVSPTSNNAAGLSLNLTEFGIGMTELQSSGYYALKLDPADGSPSLWQSTLPNSGSSSAKRSHILGRKNAVMGNPSFRPSGPSSTIEGQLTLHNLAGDRWQVSSTLSPPSLPASAQLGTSLAYDGNLFMAGMPGGTVGGRVAVYREYPEFTLMQEFKPSGGAGGDNFGAAIAIQGERVLVGAPAGWTTPGKGFVFEFQPSTRTWIQRAVLTPPPANVTIDENHGSSVALDGNTAILAASSTNLDQVTVFERVSATSWTRTATIQDPSGMTASDSGFGHALALAGDKLFVSDINGRVNGTIAGVVHVFHRSGSAWRIGATLKAPPGVLRFGYRLAVRNGVLYVSSYSSIHSFRISETPQRIPHFLTEPPIQMVQGRDLDLEIIATDADSEAGLTLRSEILPSGVTLQDLGSGRAKLVGTPPGVAGTTHFLRWRATDPEGNSVYQTTQVTVVGADQMPVLAAFPADQQPPAGSDVVLSATATGLGPFRWQWLKDGEPIPGATGPKLYLEEISADKSGTYSVSVSNIVGTVTSTGAVVAVRAPDLRAGDWATYGNTSAHHGHQSAALAGYRLIPAWTSALPNNSIASSAVIAQGRVHVQPSTYYDATGPLKTLDLVTGTDLWNFPQTTTRYVGPPSVRDGRLFFQRPGTVFRLDAATGAQDWSNSSFASQNLNYGPLAATDEGIFAINGYYGYLMGFEPDGSIRFSVPLANRDGWAPAYQNGRLFTLAGNVFQEHSKGDGTTLWSLSNLTGYSNFAVRSGCAVLASSSALTCVDINTRAVRWQVAGTFRSLPAIAGGITYAIQGNTVRSYALADGSSLTTYQTSAPLNALPSEQPIILHDRLIVSNPTQTWVFHRADGTLLQTLEGGGNLSYSNGYLVMAGTDSVLRTYEALHDNANLAGLALNSATLNPAFSTGTTDYFATVPFGTDSIRVTPTTEQADATVTVEGTTVASRSPSGPVPLTVGNQTITVRVTAEDRETTRTYRIKVTRLPRDFVFNTDADIPVTTDRFAADDIRVEITLNFEPRPGTILTMVDVNGAGFIVGRFGNLPHGQLVWLPHNGGLYPFVANYYGGTGNDLVLQWAGTRVAAWGLNNYGQLGDGSTTQRLRPVAANHAGVLADKTVFAVSTGYLHSVALCSDGTLASWGYNVQGQLGANGTSNSSVPVAVDRSGVLADKTVVAISSGSYHTLALCSDGTLAAWGFNNHGQLGNGTTTTARSPVLVKTDGVLGGKQVVAIAAGAYQSYALCSDGTVAAWGYNDEGELGNGSTTGSLVPVAVDMAGALAGRKVAMITAGQYHTLALCTDGTLVSWGYNQRGQLGNSSTVQSTTPVAIGSSGALAGKSVKAIAAGASHSMALCADGTLATWGFNSQSQLGVTGLTQSTAPLALAPPSRALAALSSGANHNLLRFTDGGMAAWGANANGQLGSNSTVPAATPVNVNTGALEHGDFIMFASSGCASSHNLAVFAAPVEVPVGIEAWRLENFTDMPIGAALAEDCADCDSDGIPNLIEYAFGFDPRLHCGGNPPQPQRNGDHIEIRFDRSLVKPDVECGVEWSPDLSPGSWHNVPDTGNAAEYLFSLPMNTAPRLFLRHRMSPRVP